MTSAANSQGFASNWGSASSKPNNGEFQGPWGSFRLPPWMPPQAVKPLLIAGMILGFVFWWPIGLALLAVLIVSKRACGWAHYSWHGPGYGYGRWGRGPWSGGGPRWGGGGTPPSSGNRAFDEYRAATLKRLEEEQKEFAEFLDRLRFAKDKAEFDQFMAERRNRAPEPPPAPQQPPQA